MSNNISTPVPFNINESDYGIENFDALVSADVADITDIDTNPLTSARKEYRIARASVYRPGKEKPFTVEGDWSIRELSIAFPVSYETGDDALLENIPANERNRVTISFTDSDGHPLDKYGDIRIFIEDVEE